MLIAMELMRLTIFSLSLKQAFQDQIDVVRLNSKILLDRQPHFACQWCDLFYGRNSGCQWWQDSLSTWWTSGVGLLHPNKVCRRHGPAVSLKRTSRAVVASSRWNLWTTCSAPLEQSAPTIYYGGWVGIYLSFATLSVCLGSFCVLCSGEH